MRQTMSMAQLKYFFSYARKDTEFVLKLATELRAVGVDVWLDQLDILGGQRWDRAIEEALQASEGIIAVLSPDSLASNNVMDEVSYALQEGKLVVPILLRRCDIPFRLRLVQHIDFVADYDLGFRQLLRALRIEQPPVTTEPQPVRKQVHSEFAAPLAEPQPVKKQVTPEFAAPLTEPTTKSASNPPALQRTPEPVAPKSSALGRHPRRYGILLGAAAGAIWGAITFLLFHPHIGLDRLLVGAAVVAPVGAVTGAICKMRWRVILVALAGGLIGWILWLINDHLDRLSMIRAIVFGPSIGVILGSVAGLIIGKLKGWK